MAGLDNRRAPVLRRSAGSAVCTSAPVCIVVSLDDSSRAPSVDSRSVAAGLWSGPLTAAIHRTIVRQLIVPAPIAVLLMQKGQHRRYVHWDSVTSTNATAPTVECHAVCWCRRHSERRQGAPV